ncbi:MAG: PAS domain S-box protein, partial [Defluviitaleaceae bacterium]|nr:PAS domain S-box protein [Defluviitaleaceae bacterium]
MWNERGEVLDCSLGVLNFFGLNTKEEFYGGMSKLAPMYQPDGKHSEKTLKDRVKAAFGGGEMSFDWVFKKNPGRHVDVVLHFRSTEYSEQAAIGVVITEKFPSSAEAVRLHDGGIRAASEMIHVVLDSAPVACFLYDNNLEIIDCNQYVIDLYEIESKDEMSLLDFESKAPEIQPSGESSKDFIAARFARALEGENIKCDWTAKSGSGKEFLCEITLRRVPYLGNFAILVYLREIILEFDYAKQIQERRASQQRMRAMLDSSPMICAIYDENHQVLEYNQMVVPYFGLSDKQEYIDRYAELIPEFQPCGKTSAEIGGKAIAKAFETGSANFEWMYQTLDGRLMPTEVHMQRVRMDDKDVVIAHGRDLTEFYKYKKAEDSAKQRMKLIIDSSPLYTSIFDAEGAVLDINQAGLDFFGFTDKQQYIDNFPYLAPEFQPNGLPSSQILVELFGDLVEGDEKILSGLEWNKQTLQGEVFPTEVTLVHVVIDGEDRILAYAKDMRDFHKLKEAESANKKRLQIMLDASPIHCVLLNHEGAVLDVNQAALEFFGLSEKREYIDNFYKLSPEFQPDGSRSADCISKNLKHVAQTGENLIIPSWMQQTLDGEMRPVEIKLVRVEMDEQPLIIAYARDLRERYKLRALEATAKERLQVMLDSSPNLCAIFDDCGKVLEVNKAAKDLFDLDDENEFITKHSMLSPEFQPDGRTSKQAGLENRQRVLKKGRATVPWMHQTLNGKLVPCEATLVRVQLEGENRVIAYVRDMSEHYKLKEVQESEEQRLWAMLNASPMLCAVYSSDFRILTTNDAALKFFGIDDKYEYIEAPSRFSPEFQPCGANSLDEMAKRLGIAFGAGTNSFEWTHQDLEGNLIPCEVHLQRMLVLDEHVVIGYKLDLRDRYKLLEAEKTTQQYFRALLDSSPIACFIFDTEYNILEANKKTAQLFELDNKQTFIKRFFNLHPEYQPDGRYSGEKIREMVNLAFEADEAHFEWMHQTLNGEAIPCEVSLVKVSAQNREIVLGYIRDLRELKQTIEMKEHLEHLAFTDSLTGIYNRRYFMEAAERELQRANLLDGPFSVIMIDADFFKKINDKYGHLAGDEVLQVLAERIKSVLRDDAVVARYGGEEFIVLIKNANHEDTV